VDAEVDVLGDGDGEVMDVGYSLPMEPFPELLGLGKDVVLNPAAWRKDERRRLGAEVPVEAEGEDGPGISWPAEGEAPPPSRRRVGAWNVEGPTAPRGQQHLAGGYFLAAEEAALLPILLAQQHEAPLVLAALLPGGHYFRRLAAFRDDGR
jgi:hypothetical protein